MNDMTSVIVAKSDQINADDLVAGPRTIRITDVAISPGTEQPVSISIEGDKKFWRPCKTMSRVLVAAWGPDAKQYVGKSVTLYRDPTVTWGALAVGGIRISHMSDIDPKKVSDGRMVVTLKESRKHSKPTVIKLLTPPTPTPTGTDAASKWTAWFIGELPKIEDVAGLDALEIEAAGKLASLKTKRPELHQQATAAADVRRAELALADDDFSTPDQPSDVHPLPDDDAGAPQQETISEASPNAEEGRDTADMGEQLFADDHPAYPAARSLIATVKLCKDDAAIDRVMAKHAADYDGLPEDLRAEVDAAVAAQRGRAGA